MKKKALLIGINYQNQKGELNGCENDVFNVKKMLVNNLQYNIKDITILTEKTKNKPTKSNILKEINKIAISAHEKNLDEIWFHFSGHGTYIPDKEGDEKDGYDECICPMDYNKNGIISDNLLYQYFSKLPKKTNCICVFDCCHSGTILDLKYRYNPNFKIIIENKNCNIKNNIISISGCKDNQTSADAFIKDKWRGAMTTSLIFTLNKNNYILDFYSLIQGMREYLIKNGYRQIPQICSNYKLDKSSIFCSKIELNSFIKST